MVRSTSLALLGLAGCVALVDSGLPPDTGDSGLSDTGNPDTDPAAPLVLAPLADRFLVAGATLTVALEVSGGDGAVDWELAGLPGDAGVDGTTLRWATGAADVGSYDVVVTVRDAWTEASATFTLYLSDPGLPAWWTDPIDGPPLLPDALIGGGGPLHLVVARGEIGRASLAVHAAQAAAGVSPAFALLDGGGAGLGVDWHVVKPWMQAGHDVRRGRPRLVPELLLHDDGLVQVVDGENYVRLADGSSRWVSEPASLDGRVIVPVDAFDVRDAPAFVPFDMATGVTRQLWLTVDVPDDAESGVHTGLVSLGVGGVERAWLPVAVEVLPFDLVPSPLTYSLYYRAVLDDDWPEGSISSERRSPDQMAADLAHMVRMGITNPTVYQAHDSDRLAEVLELRADAGMGGPLYHVGLTSTGRDPSAVQARVRAVVDLAADHGIDVVYAYGRDEARGAELTAQRDNWEAVHAGGGLNFVAGYRTTAWLGEGNFDLMGDVQDLLVCAYRPSRAEAARWHDVGARILTYESPQGGHEDPLLYRRNFGLQLWQADYDGVMTYAYMESFGTSWNDFDHVSHRDESFAYPTSDGVISTVQAAGVRAAVDDVRYVATLAAAIESADGSVDTGPASAWLAWLRDAPLGWLDLDDLRATTVGHILALTGGPTPTRGLAVTDVVVGPRDATGAVALRWTTATRASSRVEWGTTADLGEVAAADPALVYRHDVRVALPPGSAWRVGGDTATGESVFGPIEVLAPDAAASIRVAEPVEGSSVRGAVSVRLDVVTADERAVWVSVDDDLVGWWRFEGDDPGEDASGHGHHGVVNGGERVPGRFGDGLLLDGVDDYVDIGDLGVDGAGTVEGWYRFGRFPIERVASSGLHSALYHHPVNEHLYLRGTNDYFRASSLLAPGAWHHVVLTWAGDVGTAWVYVDGRPVEVSVQGETEAMPSLADFWIGRSFGYFEGVVDEVRVWRRALGPSEVRAAYDGSVGAFTLPALASGHHTLRAWSRGVGGEVVVDEVGFSTP